MPDRFQELLQQRRLIEEHLAWLNREITQATPSATGAAVAPSSSRSYPTDSAPLTLKPAVSGSVLTAAPDGDTILAEYQQAPSTLQTDVKRGCFLYFSAALALLFLGVSLLYLYSRHHPLPSTRAAAPPVEKRP